jgi:TolB-like protein
MYSKADAHSEGKVFATPPTEQPLPPDAEPIHAPELQAELTRILSSPLFAKARRMGNLLQFLIQQSQTPGKQYINEYAIGIDVFGRDAATYNTGDDPIVRVQVGRLRDKLYTYYEGEGKNNPLKIHVPTGAYMPCIERRPRQSPRPRLALQPLVCIGHDHRVASFTLGLTEELSHRLYCTYGKQLAVLMHGDSGNLPHPVITLRLQGSVRQDGDKIRTAVRLHDVANACITWSDRFDHDNDLSIARQEQLAEACCLSLYPLFFGT